MKKYCYFDGLLVIHPLIAARYSSFTYSVKNCNHYSPPLEQAKHTQAVIPAVQTAPENKPNLIARFYATEKKPQVPRMATGGPRPSENHQDIRPTSLEQPPPG